LKKKGRHGKRAGKREKAKRRREKTIGRKKKKERGGKKRKSGDEFMDLSLETTLTNFGEEARGERSTARGGKASRTTFKKMRGGGHTSTVLDAGKKREETKKKSPGPEHSWEHPGLRISNIP